MMLGVLGILALACGGRVDDIRLSSESGFLVNLMNFNYSQYSMNLSIGTPDQIVSVAIGLQTSWTWILASQCSCQDMFNTNLSTSITPPANELVLNYTKGSIIGKITYDVFNFQKFSMKNFNFLSSFKVEKLDSLKSSGLLGLGFKSLSNEYPGFLDSISDHLENKHFSIYLSPKSSQDDSFITFGGYSTNHTSGKKQVTLDVDHSEGYWKVKSDYIGFESTYFSIEADVYIDLGTSLILGPKKIINQIKRYFKKRFKCTSRRITSCTIPLSDQINLPAFSISLSSETFDIPSINYLSCVDTTCSLLLQTSSKSEIILGIPFLLSFYSLFDSESFKISLFKDEATSTSALYPILVVLSFVSFVLLSRPYISATPSSSSYIKLRNII
jgi:hypothetical protein